MPKPSAILGFSIVSLSQAIKCWSKLTMIDCNYSLVGYLHYILSILGYVLKINLAKFITDFNIKWLCLLDYSKVNIYCFYFSSTADRLRLITECSLIGVAGIYFLLFYLLTAVWVKGGLDNLGITSLVFAFSYVDNVVLILRSLQLTVTWFLLVNV